MHSRPTFNKLRHSILVTVFHSERANSGVCKKNSMLSVSHASAKAPSTRFLTSFTQVSRSRSVSIFRQRCFPIHHRSAWRGLSPSSIHIVNNVAEGPLSYGMPLVLLFRNYRYLQIFEDISNSFTDICNSITNICKRIADIRN